MRETLILKVLFTTSVSMPEQYVAESCASTVIRSESNLATAMVMVVETLKISWNISLPATVPHDRDGVWIWEITTRCGLPTTL